MSRCVSINTGRRAVEPSVVILWKKREGYPDDVQTPFACGVCGGEGYVHFCQEHLDKIDPKIFEHLNCSAAVHCKTPLAHEDRDVYTCRCACGNEMKVCGLCLREGLTGACPECEEKGL
jgi:hypothetical protein